MESQERKKYLSRGSTGLSKRPRDREKEKLALGTLIDKTKP